MNTKARHATDAILDRSGLQMTLRIPLLLLLLTAGVLARAQHAPGFVTKITYVTSEQVYFDAGTEEGIVAGDTIKVYRSGIPLGSAVVTLLAAHSCVARVARADSLFRTADLGVVDRLPSVNHPEAPLELDTTRAVAMQGDGIPEPLLPQPPGTLVHGRVALQYFGEIAADSRLNIQEPAVAANLSVSNIAGTGMNFSLNGQAVNDFTNAYPQFGTGNKSRLNLYDLRLMMGQPTDHFGFTVGRMVSGYVGSLGLLDGGQVLVRQSGMVAGAIAGRAVGQSALGIDGTQTKTAVFLGYQGNDDALQEYEGTVAYARQTLHGSLDRQFLAFQGSVFEGSSLQAYGDADLELNGIQDGQRNSKASLSNASLFVNYSYAWWLSASMSYDESRSVYLFQTMKSIPDSLFDEALQHGLRLSLTVRPLKDLSFTGSAGYRYRPGDAQPSHTLAGSMRAFDFLGTGFDATLRYTNAISPFLKGNDATVELDRMFFGRLDMTLRYDHYAFGIDVLHQVYLTQTFSLDTQYRISRSLYTMVRGDYILDNTVNSVRCFVELGLWF
ncbi:MAG TPA: hypothetical protein VMG09_01515 [Bacteroidota bacterium]|nr:hypothetical protein [Bacteroidota bacterium]